MTITPEQLAGAERAEHQAYSAKIDAEAARGEFFARIEQLCSVELYSALMHRQWDRKVWTPDEAQFTKQTYRAAEGVAYDYLAEGMWLDTLGFLVDEAEKGNPAARALMDRVCREHGEAQAKHEAEKGGAA